MVFLYFIPLFVMSILYAIIGNQLWRSGPVGVPTDIQRENVRTKKRVSSRNYCRYVLPRVPNQSLLWSCPRLL